MQFLKWNSSCFLADKIGIKIGAILEYFSGPFTPQIDNFFDNFSVLDFSQSSRLVSGSSGRNIRGGKWLSQKGGKKRPTSCRFLLPFPQVYIKYELGIQNVDDSNCRKTLFFFLFLAPVAKQRLSSCADHFHFIPDMGIGGKKNPYYNLLTRSQVINGRFLYKNYCVLNVPKLFSNTVKSWFNESRFVLEAIRSSETLL